MSIEDLPLAIHATAVAIAGRGLVIRGPSRAGKSTLALALIASSCAARPILLVGDDRVLLHRRRGRVVVSPHPRIAGLIEKRDDGILSMPCRRDVPVLGIVDLAVEPGRAERTPSGATSCAFVGQNFPAVVLVDEGCWHTRPERVLAWFAATSAAHPL